MLFSVEIANPNGIKKGKFHVEIYLDKASIADFIADLQQLKEDDSSDHVHLMSDAWTEGGELSQSLQNPKNILCHHLKILKRD